MPSPVPYQALLLLLVTLLSGCATSSLFNPYPQQAAHWKGDLSSEEPERALRHLDRRTRSADKLLYLQERARVAQIAGDIERSQADFAEVIALYDAQDQQAVVRASSAGGGVGALMVNDNALPYRGQEHERIMVHGMQALNYWQLGDLEAAAVEFRRVTLEQQVAEERRARDISRALEDSEPVAPPSDFEQELAGLNRAAADVRSSIQNAYLYYLAGVFREGVGDYNNALVDYKKAWEVNPSLSLLPADIARVEARGNRRYVTDQGQVVIAYEQGFIPPREEINLPIPTIHGYFAVAFPTYSSHQTPPSSLRVTATADNDAPIETRTEVAAALSGMAARALRDGVPGMLARQTLRATAKYEAQKRANDDLGLFGAFATQIYNLVSESADLRSWLTLPAYAQLGRLELPPGDHALTLWGTGGSATVEIPVTRGGITLVRVIDTGQRLHITVMPALEETP
ncbi:hypothetical protein K8B33_08560 [Alcanivorax sp. JB21]|uniref:COG3014 family protein n=1 Tax=Alcanivorax limicola TaxID=2874102 RepID=UPI001CBC4374|nr:hypothetical protein [Alcanivorax limicola]MBZ2189147.1 hypothetical protein [Alcanivorax limicola]